MTLKAEVTVVMVMRWLNRIWGMRGSGLGPPVQVGEEIFVLERVDVSKLHVTLGAEEGRS